LIPDLAFEVVSKSDSLEKQRQKVRDYLTLGMAVGVVVDPRTQTLEVYLSNQADPTDILKNGDVFTVPELLPG
jgi:Uma2 family endonuclease